jgi:excinuclease ABC subunit A
MPDDPRRGAAICVYGARQNNLKNIDVDFPLGELIVVTGVSGSGKSSLVFDTLYAEGQRRYVETFSPYARQFLDRMDKPKVLRIDGVPPAIAIQQANSVRTSRSTVGTMTEISDHLKLLFARTARLYCSRCHNLVRRDDVASIFESITQRAHAAGDPRLALTFPVPIPKNFTEKEIRALLQRQGYTRIDKSRANGLQVTQDQLRWSAADPARATDSIEAALRVGQGRLDVYPQGSAEQPLGVWRYSTDLHCADCDIHYQEPSPAVFSFNSAIGACETCRGFGRTIGVDYSLVIPDEAKSLRGGAIKPWQTDSYKECQDDLLKFARKRGISIDTPWRELSLPERCWVIDGEGDWSKKVWYGVKRFFAWLETRAYKMHIRVLLSRYRSYTECETCHGARLKPQALLWRVGADPGFNIRELASLPIDRCQQFFAELTLPAPLDAAAALLLGEIRARLGYLCEVGLSYLTLDRQSRTLSGGEVQRINLTTALGTSLVNTLFVLDEPTIGLHARDVGRIVSVMQRLRDAGNTLVVVEHDALVMAAADRLLDIGPGPGERGGEIVFFGPQAGIFHCKESLTADYLTGRKRVARLRKQRPPSSDRFIRIEGATENNLKNIDVDIPLHGMTCVTGVSGSGKSTLIRTVLYAALLRAKGKPTEAPGAHRRICGADQVEDVVLVDQTQIGRTTRSNPASYVGAFDAIRGLFAKSPDAITRKYTAGVFSFNAGIGRCASCGGNGFEHVEMQFLSDVYLRCADCNGTRYRPAILEVRLKRGQAQYNIAEVLELTVSEALLFFDGDRQVVTRLQPLCDVGLDYLRLGQPVPTLSGGEAQRLKLAGHLAEAPQARRAPGERAARGTLFLFDEPTTGLHFDDIAKLLGAFQRLVEAGHSLLIIEHNLDVIAAADWLIDLGPEGGDAGGQVLGAGTPADIARLKQSYTGAALRANEVTRNAQSGVADAATIRRSEISTARRTIQVRGAREHNLKNVSIDIDHGKLTVITGVSGSGKSTLAFDIVFAEGQRRYLESLNAYARQFVQPASRPDVDAVYGIPPTVAIEQRTSRGGRKSTVATMTEVYHFLRLLYVKLGLQHCPNDGTKIEPQSMESILDRLQREQRSRELQLAAPLVVARKGLYTDLAKWARKKGYAELRVDGRPLPTTKWPRLDRFVEHNIELPLPPIKIATGNEEALRSTLALALELGRGVVHVLGDTARSPRILSTKRACPRCGNSFPDLDPRLFSFNSKHGWCTHCFGTGALLPDLTAETSEEESNLMALDTETKICPSCNGSRLNITARHVLFQGLTISQLTAMSVAEFSHFLSRLVLQGREHELGRDILGELAARAEFMAGVGLDYLQLDRAAPSLSGGEAQRLRLAAQLGSNLRGVCYVLDEPTIGLHPRDNAMLLAALSRIRDKGNTLVVVEHDEETIRRADRIIDLGPGAGAGGGCVIAAGTARELTENPASITGRFLASPILHPLRSRRSVSRNSPAIAIRGASAHNLKEVDIKIPLGCLTLITGVSGSGKSTLAREVLLKNLREFLSRKRGAAASAPQGCRSLDGWESIGRVLEVDQTPIGKTPRSCPATYVGFWDNIRKIFAASTEARIRGYTASRFSFNSGDGRCPDCEGQGVIKVTMNFLPDVQVACDLCGGKRFNPDTLAVTFRGKNIGEVLAMSVEEALEFFAAHRQVRHALALLHELGLGYLRLGQRSPTLSGGESQRLKLVTELAKVPTAARPGGGHTAQTMYVLDEPTVGLHMADVERLVRAIQRLVDVGNTVVVIEHNLDLIAEADWIVDLGPEGGAGGGQVVAAGAPETLARTVGKGHTSRFLTDFLQARHNPAT